MGAFNAGGKRPFLIKGEDIGQRHTSLTHEVHSVFRSGLICSLRLQRLKIIDGEEQLLREGTGFSRIFYVDGGILVYIGKQS